MLCVGRGGQRVRGRTGSKFRSLLFGPLCLFLLVLKNKPGEVPWKAGSLEVPLQLGCVQVR